MEKNELLNEEMSITKYLKKVKVLRKAFMSEFKKDAFIKYNDDFKNNSPLLADTARVSNFDKQSLRATYNRYNKYKDAFEEALSEKNVKTNREDYLEKAAKAIKDLKALKGNISSTLVALAKGKAASTKKSNKKYDQSVKDYTRQTKNMNHVTGKKMSKDEFKQRVRAKVAKINFSTME